MLNVHGTNNLDPFPRTLHSTREAIDGLMENEANTKVLRTLGNARQSVDQTLAQNVPGISGRST